MDVRSLCWCVLKSTSQRRKLHGNSLKHMVTILQEFVGDTRPKLCSILKCFSVNLVRNLEKLRKLKDDLQDEEGEIRQLVDRTMDSHGLV